jgi:hypothetical protein
MKFINSTRTLKNLPATILLACLAAPVHAQWYLVEDFEIGMDRIFTSRWVDPPPVIGIFQDPEDAENSIFFIDSNAYGIDWGVNFVAVTLPEPIPVGSVGTLYLRFYNTGPGHNVSVGLSSTPIVPDPELPYENGMSAPLGWTDFESQNRTHAMGSDRFGVRDGSQFIDTDLVVPNNQWIEFWFLVDTTSQTTEYYMKTAADAAPVRASFLDDFGQERTSAAFRNGNGQPLVTFLLGTTSGPVESPFIGDSFFIDDVYVAPGAHILETPQVGAAATWAGYSIGPDNWVDTGDWLGRVNPVGDYVFVQSLGGWLFLPEDHVSEAGAWGYAPQLAR